LSLFEFIVGMVSIIVALAIAQMFLGVSELLQNRSRVRFFVPHALWLTNLFLLMLLHWWSLWTFKDLDWNFGMFFFTLAGPSLMFFAVTLMNPRRHTEEAIDLKEHYLNVRPLFLTIVTATYIFYSLDGPIFGTEPPFNGIRAAQGVMISGAALGLLTENARIHTALSLANLSGAAALVLFRFFPG